MRQVIHFVVLAAPLAFLASGCDQKTQDALRQEALRVAYTTAFTPVIFPSVVGSAAPVGGPAALNGLCMDQVWRARGAAVFSEADHIPSVLEIPDPNRPVRINNISTNKQYIYIRIGN